MAINFGNVNISLQQFQEISSGKYNAGEVKTLVKALYNFGGKAIAKGYLTKVIAAAQSALLPRGVYTV